MSASLVGSEMCIRDRCQAAPTHISASTACPPPPRTPRTPCLPAGWGSSRCLLYTSDAADDMQCGDL
eukprot:4394036-Alexandrium_andersonii.AAC.1